MSDEAAMWRTHQALKTIGSQVTADYERKIVKAKVVHVSQLAEITVEIKQQGDQSQISVEAFALELGVSASNSAVRRFCDAFDNFDKPGYEPDTIGISPVALRNIIGLMIVFGIVMAILNAIYHF